ncbi:MAG: diguanylate cyclase [Gammaproteobacteria bacterium]|jgi:diguanylate cyclase (GGDEF)-like protein/PAS domain S-box-containing protein
MTTDSQAFLNKVMDLLVDTVCVVDPEGCFVFVSAACERLFGYTQEELIGRNMIELVHPEDRERTLQAAERIMGGYLQTNFENRYVRKDGSVVHVMWSARWSESDGIRLAVARDVTVLKHAAHMQDALYRISEAAHSAEGLPELYRHIHGIVGELLPSDNFLVALYDKSNDALSFPYSAEEVAHRIPTQELDVDTPIAEVIQTGRSLLAVVGGPGEAFDMASAANMGCANWLGTPLISQEQVMGALVVQSKDAGDLCYTEAHKELLQFVSTQVATAIERKQKETRLQHLALHDALTGLPNRALFQDRLDMALRRAERDSEQVGLLYIDLDEFKQVNDTYGHEVGDLLLREVSRRLARCVRESDTVGRMGGDEFTVLLTNVRGMSCVEAVVNKVRDAIGAPFENEGVILTVSASIGAAAYPEHATDRDQLIRHADASMYAAKTR